MQRVAASAQAKAREVFRDDPADADGWVGQWRRAARHLSQLTADPEELKRAEEALAEDMNEENLRRLQAILDRMRRESLEFRDRIADLQSNPRCNPYRCLNLNPI